VRSSSALYRIVESQSANPRDQYSPPKFPSIAKVFAQFPSAFPQTRYRRASTRLHTHLWQMISTLQSPFANLPANHFVVSCGTTQLQYMWTNKRCTASRFRYRTPPFENLESPKSE